MTRWPTALSVLIVGIVCYGQAAPRNYAITPPRVSYSADAAQAIIRFDISNRGGAAQADSRIVVTEHLSGSTALDENLPTLAADESRSFELCLPLAELPGDDVFFRIQAGIDEFELAGSQIARDNEQLFRVSKAQASGGTGVCAGGSSAPGQPFSLTIPLINARIVFLGDSLEVNGSRIGTVATLLAALAFLALLTFCLWLLSLALRLLFRQPPKFDTWQPPYAHNNWYDINSTLGRRQSWQYHAQNNLLGDATAPNQLVLLKHLLGRQKQIMGGWRVKAMRSMQYDIYGRISRTEVLMPRGVIDGLSKLLRRAPTLDEEALRKAAQPLAKRISRCALAPIEKQNLPLPIALEMRFEGENGEARILFELFQYRGEDWQLLDAWEPDLGQTGARIPEQYAFTLNGQLPGEEARDFKRRLREDVTALLLRMVTQTPVETLDEPQTEDGPMSTPLSPPVPTGGG